MSCLLEFILYVSCSALPVATGTQLQRTLLLLGCWPFMGPSCSDIYLAYLQVSPPHCWHCWGMRLTDWQLTILKELQYWSNFCEQWEMVFGHHRQIYLFGVVECLSFESVVRPICTTTSKIDSQSCLLPNLPRWQAQGVINGVILWLLHLLFHFWVVHMCLSMGSISCDKREVQIFNHTYNFR